MTTPFIKMNGLGNDFVVIDARTRDFVPTEKFLRAAANRRRGIGCDQIIVLRNPKSADADLYMDIYNGDGSKVGACGNATRCVASLLFEELNRKSAVIETISGLLPVIEQPKGRISVDFGQPRLQWNEIPLARELDTALVPVTSGELAGPTCVSMGNPHAVFFVPDAEAVPLQELGPILEHDGLFPERCNIEVAQIIDRSHIRMRVWERGAGITEACGSGACATLVAAVRRDLADRRATIILDGGELEIEWRLANSHVIMTGSASLNYRGELPQGFGV